MPHNQNWSSLYIFPFAPLKHNIALNIFFCWHKHLLPLAASYKAYAGLLRSPKRSNFKVICPISIAIYIYWLH